MIATNRLFSWFVGAYAHDKFIKNANIIFYYSNIRNLSWYCRKLLCKRFFLFNRHFLPYRRANLTTTASSQPIRGSSLQLHGPLPLRWSNLDSWIIQANKDPSSMSQASGAGSWQHSPWGSVDASCLNYAEMITRVWGRSPGRCWRP